MGISGFRVCLIVSGAAFLSILLFSAVYSPLTILICRLNLLRDKYRGEAFTAYRTERSRSFWLKFRRRWIFSLMTWVLGGMVRFFFLNMVTLKGGPYPAGWHLSERRPGFLDGVKNHWLFYSIALLPGVIAAALFVFVPETDDLLFPLGLALYYSSSVFAIGMLLAAGPCLAAGLGWLTVLQIRLLTSGRSGSLIVSDRALCALGNVRQSNDVLVEIPARAIYIPWKQIRSLSWESGRLVICTLRYDWRIQSLTHYAVPLAEHDARKVIDRFKSL